MLYGRLTSQRANTVLDSAISLKAGCSGSQTQPMPVVGHPNVFLAALGTGDMNGIAAADYHELVHAEAPQLSPSGERVAFVRRGPDDGESYTATIDVVPVGGDEPRQFTVSDGVDSSPRWSPDGSYLAFASTRGEGDRQQLWVLPTDGGEAQRVTSVVGGIGDLEWSPDGSRLLVTQQVTAADRESERDRTVDPDYEPDAPDPRVIDRSIYRAGTEYLDGRRSHVYALDLESALEDGADSGDAITRLTDGDRDHVAPTWGDDETIYYARKLPENGDPDDSLRYELLEYDLEEGSEQAFTETTGWLGPGAIDATEDGRVAFAFTPEENASMRQTEIRVHDRTDGTEGTPTAPLDRTIGHRCGFEWAPGGDQLYVTTPDSGARTLWSVPGDGSTEPTAVYRDGTIAGFQSAPTPSRSSRASGTIPATCS